MRPETATFVRKRLAALNLSQRAFAAQIGVQQAMVYFVLSGRRPLPQDQAERWADALRLEGKERSTFLREALIDSTPRVISLQLADLEQRVIELESSRPPARQRRRTKKP